MWARMKQKAKIQDAGGGAKCKCKQQRHASFGLLPTSFLSNVPPEYAAYRLTTNDDGEVIALLKDLINPLWAPVCCGDGTELLYRIWHFIPPHTVHK